MGKLSGDIGSKFMTRINWRKQRQTEWASYITTKALTAERLPKESFEDYKERQKGNNRIIKLMLRSGYAGKHNLVPRKSVPYPYRYAPSKGNGKGKFIYVPLSEAGKERIDAIKYRKELTRSIKRRYTKVPAIQAIRTVKLPVFIH